MKIKLPWMAIILAALMFTGCSARSVLKTGDHGIVAIPGNTNAWPFRYRDKAHEMMSSHFPDGYEIFQESEAVTGVVVETDEEVVERDLITKGPYSVSTVSANVTTTTTDKTEWHIHYRRQPGGIKPGGRAEYSYLDNVSYEPQ
ncbi:MAG: hypothetical protein COA78_23840 [Blastopirellula sp.]|nr:MAG: hypothetical protein COA78_23840 [Blastopirellula sp.]